MGRWRIIYITVGIVGGIWGIPGMIEDAQVWAVWFEGWRLHNFVMVFGGWTLAVWAAGPLWKPLFFGKDASEPKEFVTPEVTWWAIIKQILWDLGRVSLHVIFWLWVVTTFAVLLTRIIRFAIRVTA